ncbi:hypothetical protein ATL31_0555 [Phycicoccus duodecadis]|uniref:Uncharacterized protein n=2 Tax=Phycicoccus duodecadis TaxID=173053 RepID=A0A2N3YFY5_9MICO|nr:hypothetical protein ATL31_0555 [Phycicoccus duodecadis]
MRYHLEGPMGRYTECATARRGSAGDDAASPILDAVVVGFAALSSLPARLGIDGHGPRRCKRHH